MGAWENGNFGNDDAMDFVADVEVNGKAEILTAIQKIAAALLMNILKLPIAALPWQLLNMLQVLKTGRLKIFLKKPKSGLQKTIFYHLQKVGYLGSVQKK